MLTDDELAAVERAIDAMARFCFPEPGNAAQARIDTLRALADRARNGGWQTIEGVLKDGTAVLYWDGEFVGIGSMFGDEMFGPEGPVHATHWMPTPKPPTGGE